MRRAARVGALRLLAGGCVLASLAVPASAQGLSRDDATLRATLSAALIRLNENPRDTEALIAAGNAALATGDTDAAVGFFTRADRLLPDNPRIEAGLAGAKVRGEDPFSAIPLFDAAEKVGPIPPEFLADRALAYDLVGDNADAQRIYNQAQARGANDEVTRRLALSLAISGDRRASEAALAPLLQKRDRAGWRTRIFALAILGYEEEAVATAKSTMPPEMALEIAPYLRYMRQLTPAQQAAAANLGHFPQASEIGHDDPRIAAFARPTDRARLASADQALIPRGTPLGNATPTEPSAKRHKDKARETAQLAVAGPVAAREPQPLPGNSPPPELQVSRDTRAPAQSALVAKPALAVPAPLLPPAPPVRIAATPPAPQTLFPASTVPPTFQLSAPAPHVATTASVAPPVVAPLAAPALTPAPALAPASTPPPAVAPKRQVAPAPPRPSFAEAFAALGPVVVDTAPARGAVDLRKITPARAVPKPPPPPPPPSHPSRIWVELGVGRDTDRLSFDWRRMVKDDPEIFRGKKPFVSSWARTNRLLVGPFETDKAADGFTEKLHKADHPTAFVWTSPAGQVVDPLEGE